MQFGLFDHCERSSATAFDTYEGRFRVARRAEQAGFYAYHIAEHHGTPLSLVPSPSVFLAALARETSTLRLCSLVYLLPLYHPYRLAQEICMLDHLSNGRMEVGIGRGANPIELNFFGLSPASAQDYFKEAYDVLMQSLVEGRAEAKGGHFEIRGAKLDVRPLQRPYPPIWYPSSSGAGSLAWAAKQGFNTVVNGPLASIAEAVKVFQDNFVPGPHGAAAKIGLTRYVFIGETDEEALRVGQQAYRHHLANLTRLMRDAGLKMTSPVIPPDDLSEAIKTGWAAVGKPATVRDQLAHIFQKVGNNYFIFPAMIGDLTTEWGLRTIELFAAEIMPAFAAPGQNSKRA